MIYSTHPPNDWRDYSEANELAHGWGWSPKQKAAEKKYNAEYWEKYKERIMAQRRKRKGLLAKRNSGANTFLERKLAMKNRKKTAKPAEKETEEKKTTSGSDTVKRLQEIREAQRMRKEATSAKRVAPGEEDGKKGSKKSGKSEAEKAAEAAEKARKKEEKAKEKAEREAERQRNKEQRAKEKAEREAERAKNKEQRAKEKAEREAEKAKNKEEKAREKAEREAEKEEKRKEKEAAKAAKDEEKRAKQEDDNRYNELVNSYRRKNLDDDNHRSALNNYYNFRRELESSGHSMVDDDTGKKLWNKFKREVARPKDSEVNEKGFVDKDVRKAFLKKAQNDEKTRASITNYSSFIKALQDAGHSEVSKEEGAAMWKEYKKKIKSSNKKAKE